MGNWIALAAGLAALPLQPALAQAQADWVEVSGNPGGARFYALADELTPAKTSAAEPTFWVKQNPTAAQGLNWYEGHALYQVNCQAQSYKILNVIVFHADGTNEAHSGENVVRQIVPQTPLADVATRVCPAAGQATGKLAAASFAGSKQ